MALSNAYFASGVKSLVGLDKLYSVSCDIKDLGNLTADTHGFKLFSIPANTHVLGIFYEGETQEDVIFFRIGYNALDAAEILANTDMKNDNLPGYAAGVAGNLADAAKDVVITAKTTADLSGKPLKVTLVCLTV